MLEVLISMFVLTIGLLSLAALNPIGKLALTDAAIADRGATLGRAAMRDVKTRGMLQPTKWVNHQGYRYEPGFAAIHRDQAWPDPDQPGAFLQNPLDGANSICIDPLFVGRNTVVEPTVPLPPGWHGATFPPKLDVDDPRVPHSTTGGPNNIPRMARVTLPVLVPTAAMPDPTNSAYWRASYALSDGIFRGRDDLLFVSPDDATLRPDMVASPSGAVQSEGNYSWLVTISPAVGEGSMTGNMRKQYTVTVVVFNQRDLVVPESLLADRGDAPPSERVVYADFLDGIGLGGGTVRLRLPITNAGIQSTPERSDMPEVRAGQWIMLCGWVGDDQNTDYIDAVTMMPPATPFPWRAVFKWYRVVAVDGDRRIETGPSGGDEWIQDITLQGPDWKFDTGAVGGVIDADGVANPHTAHAALIQGVVAVYEKTMTLDTWANFGGTP